ncbi:MAG: lipid 3-O-deacylase [Alphaproteobacteria bacterium]|nr:lipid 3-O-deacylase [Alphaproteobacteria bacterium]
MKSLIGRLYAPALLAAALSWPTGAMSADLPPYDRGVQAPVPVRAPVEVVSLYDPYRYELRLGLFAHGVGGVEKGTLDINPELVLPRLWFGKAEWWNVLVPRPHLGASVNLSGRTSAVYAGLLWSVPVTDRWFVEAFGDRAIHDGRLTDGERFNRLSMGCRQLFHVGASVGYAFAPQWAAILTFDHLSNGNSLFGIDCPRNQGTNNYGVRVGYQF